MSDHPTLPIESAEEWRPVLGLETRYEVSSLGRVRSLPAWRTRSGNIRKPTKHNGGYLVVSLRHEANGKQTRHTVHSLVAEAFLGRRPPGQVVRHLDGDPANNVPSNLEWGTQQENGWDTTAHGRNHNANKTHCVKGHKFTPENTGTSRVHGVAHGRYCKTCLREASRRRRQREREQREAA